MPNARKKVIFPALTKTLWQLIGPSVVFVALSLNGGELMIWPSLVANYGMRILWPIPIILVLQFFVNMEIERYTLVTGKSVEENLVGNVRWLAAVFALTVVVTLVWPAWMTTAGNLFVALALPGLSEGDTRVTGLMVTIGMMILTLLVFRSRETYQRLEQIARLGLAVTSYQVRFLMK